MMEDTVNHTPIQAKVAEYIAQLNDKEKIAYNIAKDHLGTSFSIVKSIGFMEWTEKQSVGK